MDPLSAIIEIFVLSITVAIFGGLAMLIALDAKTDRTALETRNTVTGPLVCATVHQIQPRVVRQTEPSNTSSISKAA